MISNEGATHWRYVYLVRRINIEFNSGRLRLIYIEENKVADLLAKMAYSTSARIGFRNLEDFPREAQRLIFLDIMGLPSFR